ncbi:hypothetical protein [Goodfellowiella coeruleoviolacea]|uniref:Uncharacterized protein n=1 Tax=Goodfellowiella coeruleoviolacea TaxID=334858 RepID=A0AAE3GCI9_9PSEU|nr:hypothetical protein [Goodfellowiella coeruleoviolacea]MCP2164904.1 hypothetical protein [Goodfellowiella coeruleoviolacea]
MSGEETSFIEWRNKAKNERDADAGGGPKNLVLIGVVAAVVIIAAVVVGLMLLS